MLQRVICVSIALLAATMDAQPPAKEPVALKGCELVRGISQFDGKVIRVRGVLQNSDGPDDAFFDEFLPDTCSEAPGRRIVIHVQSPDVHFLANPPRGYRPNMKSVQRVESLLKKAAADGRRVSVTIEGLLVVATSVTPTPARHKPYPASIIIAAIYEAKER
jgi:hypothetical protein